MNELKELFYLIGLDFDEEPIPPEYNNGIDSYLHNGERILTLARNKKHRRLSKYKNLTVRFFNFSYPKLNSNRQTAIQQLKKSIKNSIKQYTKKVESKEYLESECIPFLLNNFRTVGNLEIMLPDSEYDLSLSKTVSKSNLVILVKLANSKFYVPLNPCKRFSDSSYYYKYNSKHRINICHAETIFYCLSIISYINEIIEEKNRELFEPIIKSVLEEISRSLSEEDKTCLQERGVLNSEKCLEYVANEPMIRLSSSLETFALYILHHVISNQIDSFEEQKHRNKLDGMVARAYTTKRNIPSKITRLMEDSPLNEFFGFIEFDEDVDLQLVNLITQEFMRLNKYVFHGLLSKDVSLRFRKLGRHHATGLYYPSISTMVVDLRCPSSFVHEYFHMIDDFYNDLSLDYEFSPIVLRYQELLDKNVEEAKKKGMQLVSKGKYNLAYYKRKSEIFARCGEIFLFRLQKIESSLLKPADNESFCYPDDLKLNHMIEQYYGTLFSKLGKDNNLRKEESYEKNIHIANH